MGENYRLLTAWELRKHQISYHLICDNMAATLLQQQKVQLIIVGADRIASNGDTANKISTYNLAVLAHYHAIPFYVAAPYTTIDWSCPTGQSIPIEQRHAAEVRGFFQHQLTCSPIDVPVYNPAFDVTPAELITGFILDNGIFTAAQLHC